jgi:hypothetical protein
MKKSATALWLRLIFTMTASALITLCFFTGAVTLKSGSLQTGFATGLVMTSLVLLAQFKLSQLTKGLSIALPREIVDETAKQSIEVIAGGNIAAAHETAPSKAANSAIKASQVTEPDPVAQLFNQQ